MCEWGVLLDDWDGGLRTRGLTSDPLWSSESSSKKYACTHMHMINIHKGITSHTQYMYEYMTSCAVIRHLWYYLHTGPLCIPNMATQQYHNITQSQLPSWTSWYTFCLCLYMLLFNSLHDGLCERHNDVYMYTFTMHIRFHVRCTCMTYIHVYFTM